MKHRWLNELRAIWTQVWHSILNNYDFKWERHPYHSWYIAMKYKKKKNHSMGGLGRTSFAFKIKQWRL